MPIFWFGGLERRGEERNWAKKQRVGALGEEEESGWVGRAGLKMWDVQQCMWRCWMGTKEETDMEKYFSNANRPEYICGDVFTLREAACNAEPKKIKHHAVTTRKKQISQYLFSTSGAHVSHNSRQLKITKKRGFQ